MTSLPWGLVLDADVLLRSSARDLFLYLASLEVIDPVWSPQIMDEVARNFPAGRERFESLRAALEGTFPRAGKTGFEHLQESLTLTSEKDRHVLALAGEYEADLVSFNHRHYNPGEARRHGVTVWPPDDALARVIQHRPEEARLAVARAYRMLRRPPVEWADFVGRIRADGMPKVAAWVASLPEPQRTDEREQAASRPTGGS